MGIIRGGALAVVSVFLLIGVFASMLFLTMAWSLNYSNVKVELGGVIKDSLNDKLGLEQVVSDNFVEMQSYCNNYDDYALNFQGRTIVIPCNVISQDVPAVVNRSVDSYIEKIYFQQYNCEFWSCFKEEAIPFFLVSVKAQAYWYSLFNYALMVVAVLSILGFLLAEKKSNFFVLVSVLIVLCAIPFAKMDWIIGLTGKTASGLLGVFFSKGYSVFIRGIIVGAFLLLAGFIMKLFKVGFKISTIFVKSKEEKLEEKITELKKDKKEVSREVKSESKEDKKIVKKTVIRKKKKEK